MSDSGSGMGHEWNPTSTTELVHWSGVPIRHGSLGGRPHTSHARWRPNDPRFDSVIADNISNSCWVMIKKYFNLNNNLADPKRGMEKYDPCGKFDLIYKVMVHNMNYVTKRADSDGTIDESSWGFGGYMAECGGRLIGKKVPKGGQTTFWMDIHRRYPRAYIHRHKLQTPATRPDGFSYQGQAEVVDIVTQIDRLIDETEPGYTECILPNTTDLYKYPTKKIYRSQPHVTADNHFSGDNVMKFIGTKGYGITVTCRRDRFPTDIKSTSIEKKLSREIRWQRR
jgi:hypothetical protein